MQLHHADAGHHSERRRMLVRLKSAKKAVNEEFVTGIVDYKPSRLVNVKNITIEEVFFVFK